MIFDRWKSIYNCLFYVAQQLFDFALPRQILKNLFIIFWSGFKNGRETGPLVRIINREYDIENARNQNFRLKLAPTQPFTSINPQKLKWWPKHNGTKYHRPANVEINYSIKMKIHTNYSIYPAPFCWRINLHFHGDVAYSRDYWQKGGQNCEDDQTNRWRHFEIPYSL